MGGNTLGNKSLEEEKLEEEEDGRIGSVLHTNLFIPSLYLYFALF